MAEKKKNSVPAAEQTKSVEETEIKKEKTYTKKELDQIVEEAIRKCTEKTQSCGTVLQVVPDENVTLMFFGVIAPGTVVDLKKMGQFNRPGVALKVKKSEFFQNNTLLISTIALWLGQSFSKIFNRSMQEYFRMSKNSFCVRISPSSYFNW